mgnify:FL=1
MTNTAALEQRREGLKVAEAQERALRGLPDIDHAVALLWGAVNDDGTLGAYPDLASLEMRILGALKALQAWPKDMRRFGGVQ